MSKVRRAVVAVVLLGVLAVPATAYAEASIYRRLNIGDGTVYSTSSIYKWYRASQWTNVSSSSSKVTARIQSRSTSTATWYTRASVTVSAGSGAGCSTSYPSTQYWRLALAPSIWGLGSAEGVLNIYN